MKDQSVQPSWPTEGHESRAEAVAAAFDEMRADGATDPVVLIHQATCAVRWDLKCDCAVTVIPEMGGEA